jgi:hypothetical protein
MAFMEMGMEIFTSGLFLFRGIKILLPIWMSYYYRPGRLGGQEVANATFTFRISFLLKNLVCGPEARALHGKSIGGKRNPIGDLTVLPQDEAGPLGRPVGRPYTGTTLFSGKERIARPAQETRYAL